MSPHEHDLADKEDIATHSEKKKDVKAEASSNPVLDSEKIIDEPEQSIYSLTKEESHDTDVAIVNALATMEDNPSLPSITVRSVLMGVVGLRFISQLSKRSHLHACICIFSNLI